MTTRMYISRQQLLKASRRGVRLNVSGRDAPGQVMAVLDDNKCIVVKRGIQYQVIH